MINQLHFRDLGTHLVVALALCPGCLGLGDPGDGHAEVLDEELLPLGRVLAAAHAHVPAQGGAHLIKKLIRKLLI